MTSMGEKTSAPLPPPPPPGSDAAPRGSSPQPGGTGNFKNLAKGGNRPTLREAAAAEAQRTKAAMEDKARSARDQTERLAAENQATMQQNVEIARQTAKELREMEELPGPALKTVTERADQMHTLANDQMDRNKAAVNAARREAERTAQEVKAHATAVGQQALQEGSRAAAAAVDIARGEYDARWAKVLEQEKKLKDMALEIERKEKQLSLMLQKGEPNWPSCHCCCIEPVVHHDILGDIPIERQSFVRKSYVNYWCTCILLVLNCGVAVAMLLIDDKKDSKKGEDDDSNAIQHLVVSCIYLVGLVMAFVLWYWPLYKACGTGSSGQYIMSFIGLVVGFIFDVFTAIGPEGYGGTGVMYSMKIRDRKGDGAFYAVVIMAICWICQAIFFIWMIIRLRMFYKVDKASLRAAKAEVFTALAVAAA